MSSSQFIAVYLMATEVSEERKIIWQMEGCLSLGLSGLGIQSLVTPTILLANTIIV